MSFPCVTRKSLIQQLKITMRNFAFHVVMKVQAVAPAFAPLFAVLAFAVSGPAAVAHILEPGVPYVHKAYANLFVVGVCCFAVNVTLNKIFSSHTQAGTY